MERRENEVGEERERERERQMGSTHTLAKREYSTGVARKTRYEVWKREQPVLAGARSAWRASTEIESRQPPTTRPVTLPAFLTATPLLLVTLFLFHGLSAFEPNLLGKHVHVSPAHHRHY